MKSAHKTLPTRRFNMLSRRRSPCSWGKTRTRQNYSKLLWVTLSPSCATLPRKLMFWILLKKTRSGSKMNSLTFGKNLALILSRAWKWPKLKETSCLSSLPSWDTFATKKWSQMSKQSLSTPRSNSRCNEWQTMRALFKTTWKIWLRTTQNSSILCSPRSPSTMRSW